LPARTVSPFAYARAVAARHQPQAIRATDAAAWERYLNSLPIGSKVKVETADGKSFKGTFMGVDAGNVTVKPKTRIPEPVRSIPIASLASLDLDQGTSTAKVVAIAAGAAGAAVLGVLLIVIAAVGD
jgi:hypothetical protein